MSTWTNAHREADVARPRRLRVMGDVLTATLLIVVSAVIVLTMVHGL